MRSFEIVYFGLINLIIFIFIKEKGRKKCFFVNLQIKEKKSRVQKIQVYVRKFFDEIIHFLKITH